MPRQTDPSRFLTGASSSIPLSRRLTVKLWLGVVLLEIPSNVVLQRIGPHNWIPIQIVAWGIAETLTFLVKSKSGWWAARIFLGSKSRERSKQPDR